MKIFVRNSAPEKQSKNITYIYITLLTHKHWQTLINTGPKSTPNPQSASSSKTTDMQELLFHVKTKQQNESHKFQYHKTNSANKFCKLGDIVIFFEICEKMLLTLAIKCSRAEKKTTKLHLPKTGMQRSCSGQVCVVKLPW